MSKSHTDEREEHREHIFCSSMDNLKSSFTVSCDCLCPLGWFVLFFSGYRRWFWKVTCGGFEREAYRLNDKNCGTTGVDGLTSGFGCLISEATGFRRFSKYN